MTGTEHYPTLLSASQKQIEEQKHESRKAFKYRQVKKKKTTFQLDKSYLSDNQF